MARFINLLLTCVLLSVLSLQVLARAPIHSGAPQAITLHLRESQAAEADALSEIIRSVKVLCGSVTRFRFVKVENPEQFVLNIKTNLGTANNKAGLK